MCGDRSWPRMLLSRIHVGIGRKAVDVVECLHLLNHKTKVTTHPQCFLETLDAGITLLRIVSIPVGHL